MAIEKLSHFSSLLLEEKKEERRNIEQVNKKQGFRLTVSGSRPLEPLMSNVDF
jgi:hypothetical protein